MTEPFSSESTTPVFTADTFLDESGTEPREGQLVFAPEGVLFLANQKIKYRYPIIRIGLLLGFAMSSAALVLLSLVYRQALGERLPLYLGGGLGVFAFTAAAGWLLLRVETRRAAKQMPPNAPIEEVVTWPGCWRVPHDQVASIRVALGGHAAREVVFTVTSEDGSRRTLNAPHSFMMVPKKLAEEVRSAADAQGWRVE